MKYSTLIFTLLLSHSFFAQVEEMQLLGHWKDTTLVGSLFYNNTYNEVWGIAKNGHEYAIVGSTAGTHFIDVSEPSSPFEAFFVEGNEASSTIIHRDYHDFGDYLFAVADEGNSTLQIIDISALPDTIEVVYDDANLIYQAHNIYIDDSQQRLYTFASKGGSSTYSAMRIYDISKAPTVEFLATHNTFGGIRISHAHDGYVSNHIAYLNCGNNGFLIIDFSDPNNPIVRDYISPSSYAQSGYNHSGWVGSACEYYYMADENWGKGIKVVDIRTAGEAEVVTIFDAGSDSPYSIPHNQIVACNYLYSSYYYDGLQVYDLSDPKAPKRVAYFNTSTKNHRPNYEGAWGVYPFLPSGNILVSDMQEGLFILEGMNDNCDANAKDELCSEQATSTKDINLANSIFIYPQPAQQEINIELNQAISSEQIQLFDLNGRIVKEWNIRAKNIGNQLITLDLPNYLPNGIYHLRLGNNLVKKVVIMK